MVFQRWSKIGKIKNIQYEDLSLKTSEVMQNIINYLGIKIEPDKIFAVVDKYNTRKLDEEAFDCLHFHKGQIGSYKSDLTNEKVQYLNDQLKNEITAMGYAI